MQSIVTTLIHQHTTYDHQHHWIIQIHTAGTTHKKKNSKTRAWAHQSTHIRFFFLFIFSCVRVYYVQSTHKLAPYLPVSHKLPREICPQAWLSSHSGPAEVISLLLRLSMLGSQTLQWWSRWVSDDSSTLRDYLELQKGFTSLSDHQQMG